MSFNLIATPKKLAIVGVVLLCLLGGSFTAGRYIHPSVKTVTVTKTQDRIVEKQVIQFKDRIVHDQQTNIQTRTVTQWLPQPNGQTAVTTTTTTQDESKTEDKEVTKVSDTNSKDEVTTQETKTTTTPASKPNYQLGLFALEDIHQLTVRPNVFGVEIDRRLLGNFYAGITVNTNGMFGLSLRLAF